MPTSIRTWDKSENVDILANKDWGDISAGRGPGRSGTAQGGTATSITLDLGASALDDVYNTYFIVLTAGPGAGQSNVINDYIGSTRQAIVATAWGVQPTAITEFIVFKAEKFFVENTSTRVLRNLRAKIVQIGANDGFTRLRFAADVTTVVRPWGVTATLGASDDGGTWSGTGTRYYRITAINATGETCGSNEVQVTVDNVTKRVTLNWVLPSGATGIKVYRSTVAGVYTTPALRTTLGAVTSFVDDGASVSAGALPSSNTTAGPSPHFGYPPTLGITSVFIGDLDIGEEWVYWAGPDFTPVGSSEDGNPRQAYIQLEEE